MKSKRKGDILFKDIAYNELIKNDDFVYRWKTRNLEEFSNELCSQTDCEDECIVYDIDFTSIAKKIFPHKELKTIYYSRHYEKEQNLNYVCMNFVFDGFTLILDFPMNIREIPKS